jgi:2-isopropylmalate synthase
MHYPKEFFKTMEMNHIQTGQVMHVETFDTVPRDGAQSLPKENKFPRDSGVKVAIADAIAKLGVNTIEAGFPATDHDGEEVSEVAASVGRTEYSVTPKTIVNGELEALPVRLWTPIITGLTLAKPKDIEETWQAVQGARYPGIHTFVATAETHMRAKHSGMNQGQVLEMAVKAMRHARDVGGANTRVQFSCEAASTSDMATLERFVRSALQEDIDVINLPDTLGAASPIRMARIFSEATKWMIEEGRQDDVIISSHNHNDGERAVQNAISSMHAVIDTALAMGANIPRFQFEGVAAPGTGERNGNAFLAAYVRDVLTDRQEFNAEIDLSVDTTLLKYVAEFVLAQAGLTVDPNTPVVGKATAEHRAGVHSDAIVKGGASMYAHVNPMWFGHPHAAIIEDGDYQGASGRDHLGATDQWRSELVRRSSDIQERIEAIGMAVDGKQLERITVKCNKTAKAQKRPIADVEIEAFVAEETGEAIVDQIAVGYSDEKTQENTAFVILRTPEGEKKGEVPRRGGSISSLIHAANAALNFEGDVDDFRVYPLAEGMDAAATVSFAVKQNGHAVTSAAESESVDQASLHAYIKAVNLIDRIAKRQAKV